jgi:CBS domain-containing protein
MIEKRVGTMPIVDSADILVGMTTIGTIMKLFLPDFVALLSDIDFVKDYGDLKFPSQERFDTAKDMPITEVMEEPTAIEGDRSLINALAMLHKHNLQDLPVLKQGKLVGIVSRVDIGREFFSAWRTS